MYPGKHAQERPDKPAFIMASTGEAVTYGEFEGRANRLAHLLRAVGLRGASTTWRSSWRSNARFLECCAPRA